ncbi:hypothetical protein GJ496_000714 [Pomphorhynchus laevis]|nr:hypothetical protein GJ496_000714 [Pomphorhynchus laevis]
MYTPLIDFNQASDLTITQDAIRKGIGAVREQMYEEELKELHDQTNGKWKQLLQYASERGASSWLSGKPFESSRCRMISIEFREGLSIRYNKLHDYCPNRCGCGALYEDKEEVVL